MMADDYVHVPDEHDRVFLIEGEGGMSDWECILQIDEGYSAWCDSNASAVGIVKFDSGASRNLTGVGDRLLKHEPISDCSSIAIKGFNDSVSYVDAVGINEDNKIEYYVSAMPSNLTLLSAHDYAKDGAAVLLKDEGLVLKLNDNELQSFQKYIKQIGKVVKKLTVNNRTYEVLNQSKPHANQENEEAYSGVATKYFNSCVHVSNLEERILAMLLTGLSFRDLYSMVSYENAEGLPRDITIQSLNNFAHKYGRTPDVLQLATPNMAGNRKGYMAPPVKVSQCGERVEADYFYCEFNEVVESPENQPNSSRKVTRKLISHGGAVAAYVTVDVYSGYVHGQLVKDLSNTLTQVKQTVDQYTTDNHKIESFAADVGILTQSDFRIYIPAVEAYLRENNIKTTIAEAYNHNNGTAHIERTIRSIKELIRFATLYIINNPNFKNFGFTKKQVLKLWGDLFYWSIVILNLKTCPRVKEKTKYEVYTGKQPDLRNIRLLPIGSILYVFVHSANPLESRRDYWKKALYLGPSDRVAGAIRAAIITNNTVLISTTNMFKGVSDGGRLDPYESVERVATQLLDEGTSQEAGMESNNQLPSNEMSPSIGAEESEPPSGLDTSAIIVPSTIVDNATVPSSDLLLAVQAKGVDRMPSTIEDSTNELPSESHSSSLSVPSTDIPIDASNALERSIRIDSNKGKPKKKSNQTTNKNKKSKNKSNRVINKSALADQERFEEQKASWGTRSERMKNRNKNVAMSTIEEICHFVDWTTYESENYYFSYTDHCYIRVADKCPPDFEVLEPRKSVHFEEGFRAVTVNIPKSFSHALSDPIWGDAARKEFNTILVETRAVVEVDQEIAREHIRNGAEVLNMIAVYEEKIKEGVVVKKVRLVADGRRHLKHGSTYSPTPSREELFILLHYFAVNDYDFYHLDEVRAFLNVSKSDKESTYAKFSGSKTIYEIMGALYGLKTSPRDYTDAVEKRMLSLGFKRLHIAACIYYREHEGKKLWAYCYVDDFVCGGNNIQFTNQFIEDFRKVTNTTEPIMNPKVVLGIEIEKNRKTKTIALTMESKINELVEKCSDKVRLNKSVPIPTTGYLTREEQFEELPESKKQFLDKEGITTYMSIIGCLIWIQGVRLDIVFAVLYLSWFTKSPRQHHLDMAYYCVGYLGKSAKLPLVLGGSDANTKTTVYTDASLGTGPNGRSVKGALSKLHPNSGAISAKASATQAVVLSSFEAELDGYTTASKIARRIENTMQDLHIENHDPQPIIYNDNKAMIDYIHGDGTAKGVRHMQLRLWYLREQYKKGYLSMQYMPGNILPADKLTKLGNKQEHEIFCRDILGLNLLEDHKN